LILNLKIPKILILSFFIILKERILIYDILPVNNYVGNNLTTTFDFDFYVEKPEQLQVFLFDENNLKHELIYGVDYSINELKNKNGSFINFPLEGSSYEVLSDNQKISLDLTLPISQDVEYTNSSLLNLETLEYSFDYVTRLIQILARKLSLCVKIEEISDISADELISTINNNVLLSNTNALTSQNYFNQLNSLYSTFNAQLTQFNLDKANIENNLATVMSDLSTKASKTEVDGQWVFSSIDLLRNVDAPVTTAIEIDLSEYLPDDNYNYEIDTWVFGRTGTTNGNESLIQYGSDIYPSGSYLRTQTKVSGACPFWSNAKIPVGTQRKLIVMAWQSNTGTIGHLGARGYRRLGTNL